MSILTDLISKALRITKPQATSAQSSAPAILPIPTPNLSNNGGTGAGTPTTNTVTGQPSWDASRAGSQPIVNSGIGGAYPKALPVTPKTTTSVPTVNQPSGGQPIVNIPPQDTNPNPEDGASSEQERIQSEEDKALQAAIGVFEARKAGVMNQIPGLQNKLQNTLSGYDANLTGFTNEADRSQTQKLNELGVQEGAVNEEYIKSARDTRNTAKSLAKQLKNMFAGKGSLDSTQYKDMNIDQATDIARTIGDTNREQAGKISAIGTEKNDIKQYYTEQVRAEQQRVKIAKESAQIETDDLIQKTIDDANLTDAQKVETVVAAQNRLSSRMAELDAQTQALAQKTKESDRDYALKVAELQKKGYSDSYTTAMNSGKAIQQATAVIANYTSKYNPTPEQATQFAQKVFTQYGVPKEEADAYSAFFGVPTKDQTSDLGWSAE